jgi:hypothetical protein
MVMLGSCHIEGVKTKRNVVWWKHNKRGKQHPMIRDPTLTSANFGKRITHKQQQGEMGQKADLETLFSI